MQQSPEESLVDSPDQEKPSTEESRIQQQEVFFRQFVESKLFYSFSKELEKFGYTKDQLEDFYRFFDSLKDHERLSLLAFPWELKQRALPAFKKKVDAGMQMSEMLKSILEANKTQSRKVAYHCSSENILPKKENDGAGKMVEQWKIVGTEYDHRDNDLSRSYYSFDYHKLYREKAPKFIYIVSIQTGPGSGHQKDGRGVYGRAGRLDVIEKIDISEADKYISDAQKEYPEEKKAA